MLPSLALAALCVALVPSSLALPVAGPATLDLANWRSLPPSLTLYDSTLPTHPDQHVRIAAPPPPPPVKRAPATVIRNPKYVPNPKAPGFSSSLAAAKSSSTTTTTRSTTTTMSTITTTTTTSAAKPTSTVYKGGWATFYYQGGNPGHCGWWKQDTDYIVALPTKTYANGAHCGKYVRVTRVSSGESVVAMVADSCPSCVNNESIDMSYVAFTSIATEEEGMVSVTWEFI
ncbi:RlpA-like double-psi beta-barrel-protein domain-containing protein-containing protein [Rhodotorula diobovata]|uniref:RlpA-like double-psi beta-barrel-protein domain-containing protein-containing protein n=1 Tax=Rhodotorula diobovata TaxID=5288 RepID=A0A5C5FWF2_9BASI|nr:RlpA-like double-psi beta-barrel-protein domain-containing protein-containing protein [Rhodotorula diobovata]